jgi:hypothetical protein
MSIKVINDALLKAGFKKTTVEPTAYISLDTGEVFVLDFDRKEQYMEEITAIPGVIYDEGQGEGYYFHVDLSEFTPESERLLLEVVKKYALLNKRDERNSKRRLRRAGHKV